MSINSHKQLAQEGTLLFISTLIVNAGNYGMNLLLGRWLGPTAFSEVSLLVTLLLMLSFFALAFQLTATKFITELSADNQTEKSVNIVAWLHNWATIIGIGLAVLMLGLSFFWKDFFQTDSITPFLIFGFGLPIYLLMSVNRGVLQGQGNYRKLALTYQTEMWVRLVVSVALVWAGFGVNGFACGLSLSLLMTLLISKTSFQVNTIENIDYKPIIHFLKIILLYECSQILINNSDTILVKHYFSPLDAGLYAALALIGRIVYFGTWTVVTILFPTVIKLEKEGKNHLNYFLGGLLVVTIIAALIVLGSYLFPTFIVQILFGEAYLSIAPLLWKYALATALFACANVFVYYHLSLNRQTPVWFTLVAGILQIIFIVLFHQSFGQIVQIQIIIMFSLLLIMIGYQFNHFKQIR